MRNVLNTFLALCIAAGAAVTCGENTGAPQSSDLGSRTILQGLTASEARAARQAEVRQYLNDRYLSRIRPLETKSGPFGETVDWVDPHDLDPLFDSRVPPPAPVGPAPASALGGNERPAVTHPTLPPRGYDLAAVWNDPKYKGPKGTVPIIRPDFGFYVDGKSDARSLEEFIRSIASPQPAGRKRLYGGRVHVVSNIGTVGFATYHDFAGVELDTFSLVQLALLCRGSDPDNTLESVEVGINKHPQIYNDNNVHFFVFFTTEGYKDEQVDFVRGYNRMIQGFVTWPGAFPPGAVLPVIDAGGERQIRAVRSGSAWWVQDTVPGGPTTTLGYYPIGTAAGQINFDLIGSSACEALWYGEVFDKTEETPFWTSANMGNGVFGTSEGSPFFRQMIVERDSGGNLWFGSGAPTTDLDPSLLDANCYTASPLLAPAPGFDVWFRFGGPGGDAAGCD
jgi:hypothetical protein